MVGVLEQVKYSLEAAKLAQTNASRGVYDASAGMLIRGLIDHGLLVVFS